MFEWTNVLLNAVGSPSVKKTMYCCFQLALGVPVWTGSCAPACAMASSWFVAPPADRPLITFCTAVAKFVSSGTLTVAAVEKVTTPIMSSAWFGVKKFKKDVAAVFRDEMGEPDMDPEQSRTIMISTWFFWAVPVARTGTVVTPNIFVITPGMLALPVTVIVDVVVLTV